MPRCLLPASWLDPRMGLHQGHQSPPRLAEEQSVGTHIDVSHEAATPPGLEVTASVELIGVEGRKLIFAVSAMMEWTYLRGRHERVVINKENSTPR